MPTKPIYQYDASQRSLPTTITSSRALSTLSDTDKALFKLPPEEEARTSILTTAETIFHPKGGGQPSDVGTMKAIHGADPFEFNVTSVRKSPTDSAILHAGTQIQPSSSPTLENLRILQELNNPKRDYHSRLHTAGHLIDLAIEHLITSLGELGKSKANHHPGEAFVEYIGSIPNEAQTSIQDEVNSVVRANHPVNIVWWDEKKLRDSAVAAPDTIPPPEGGLYRVVDIEGSCCPCGGTHLPKTGDVGEVVVKRISRRKGVSKVYYEVLPAL